MLGEIPHPLGWLNHRSFFATFFLASPFVSWKYFIESSFQTGHLTYKEDFYPALSVSDRGWRTRIKTGVSH